MRIYSSAGWEPLMAIPVSNARLCTHCFADTLNFNKGGFLMNVFQSDFISVGIDVAADFSVMCIMTPDYNTFCKPFKVIHTDLGSMNSAVATIKKAEKQYQMTSQIFLESTGIYHFPLFCFLKESGFEVFVLNPLITNSTKNIDIRKVKNDKFDSVKIAKLGFDPKIKKSLMPEPFVMDIKCLCREYFSLTDSRTALINRLSNTVRMAFPAYIGIFSETAGVASMTVLSSITSLTQLISETPKDLNEVIAKAARKGIAYGDNKLKAVIDAAVISQKLTVNLSSPFPIIHAIIKRIELLDSQINDILATISDIVKTNPDNKFINQILILDSIPGVGFLSAVTIMCEIGDFSAFKSPKQLFAYFGIDPSVNESGKFKGNQNRMSKRGSRFARRVIFAISLASVRTKANGVPINPVIRDYYAEKIKSKPKKVALGAVMHKICNIVFAVLRNNTNFTLKTNSEHCLDFISNTMSKECVSA